MGYFRGAIRSDALNMTTHLNVILPERGARAENTLLLLHGLSGGADDWVRKTGIERYAVRYNLAVFMPEVQRSWYMDMKYGLNYFTYVSEELPRLLAGSFQAPMDSEHLYVAGLSMGGYGATKCALRHPERFAGLIALSSRFFLTEKLAAIENDPAQLNEWRAILGEELTLKREDCLECLLEQASPAMRHMPVYMACGTEDVLYGESVRMSAMMREKGWQVTMEEWPGVHDWAFWDKAIQRALACLLGD